VTKVLMTLAPLAKEKTNWEAEKENGRGRMGGRTFETHKLKKKQTKNISNLGMEGQLL
jgi:hypothetical protein